MSKKIEPNLDIDNRRPDWELIEQQRVVDETNNDSLSDSPEASLLLSHYQKLIDKNGVSAESLKAFLQSYKSSYFGANYNFFYPKPCEGPKYFNTLSWWKDHYGTANLMFAMRELLNSYRAQGTNFTTNTWGSGGRLTDGNLTVRLLEDGSFRVSLSSRLDFPSFDFEKFKKEKESFKVYLLREFEARGVHFSPDRINLSLIDSKDRDYPTKNILIDISPSNVLKKNRALSCETVQPETEEPPPAPLIIFPKQSEDEDDFLLLTVGDEMRKIHRSILIYAHDQGQPFDKRLQILTSLSEKTGLFWLGRDEKETKVRALKWISRSMSDLQDESDRNLEKIDKK